ncbi:MAG: 2,3-diphosphoglycerate-dependent phosphoglycerate mutase [Pseudomonadota bacterium]
MSKLALLRHGQSEWNLQNRFTGWVDVSLTDKGIDEARQAGELLKQAGVEFDGAYTSVLTRAIKTLNLTLEEMDRLWLPVVKDWRLNERHYGGLTGLNKAETAEKHGDDQVKIWRRSFDTPPPPIDPDSPHNPTKDQRYVGMNQADLPDTESLKTTLDRVEPYWRSVIEPRLLNGDALIIAAHGNSLRAIVKLLFGVGDADIVNVEIPTGNPLLIELAPGTVRPTSARYLNEDRATTLPQLP